jgi:hypothetical protein
MAKSLVQLPSSRDRSSSFATNFGLCAARPFVLSLPIYRQHQNYQYFENTRSANLMSFSALEAPRLSECASHSSSHCLQRLYSFEYTRKEFFMNTDYNLQAQRAIWKDNDGNA